MKASFLQVATPAQVSAAERGHTIWITCKADAVKFEKAGIPLVRENSRNWYVANDARKEIHNALNERGPAVKIVRIEERYCHDMGAYQVVHAVDAENRSVSKGNKYDTTVDFNAMSESDLLAYINK